MTAEQTPQTLVPDDLLPEVQALADEERRSAAEIVREAIESYVRQKRDVDAALAEALGRLISLNLRILSPLSQTDRAQEIAEQLRGIGGSRSVGFGMQQVRSLPDAVARALEIHIETSEDAQEQAQVTDPPPLVNGKKQSNGSGSEGSTQTSADEPLSLSHLSVIGNLCPKCGCNTMVHEEGCRKCYNCGHSEC